MYGKFFSAAFTGSMMGAGGTTFAVWAYAISNADERGYVELNAQLLSALIGDKPDAIVAAIKKLMAPDPRSRSKAEDGRRMVREGQFIYRIVNYVQYRKMRDQDERRTYQREWTRNKRAKPLDRVDRRRPPSTQEEEEAEEEEKEEKITECAAPAKPAAPPVLVYPTNGSARTWDLTEAPIRRWGELFPGLDVLGSCRDALAWVEANPMRRKTPGGMTRFLAGWLSRNQNRGDRMGPGRQQSLGGTDVEAEVLRMAEQGR